MLQLFSFPEYAAVGYVAKRIDMRKRHLAAIRYLEAHRDNRGGILKPSSASVNIWIQPQSSSQSQSQHQDARLPGMEMGCTAATSRSTFSHHDHPPLNLSGGDREAIQLARTLTDLRAQMGDGNVCAVTPSTIDK